MIWNTAGVGSILAKELRKLGHEADVIMRKSYDSLGITAFYDPQGLIDMTGDEFKKYALSIAADYDVIHVNSVVGLVTKLRRKYRNKKVFYHVHGGEYNNKHPWEYNQYRNLSVLNAKKVFAATPDLMTRAPFYKKFNYLPTPIDRDLFRHGLPTSSRVLTFGIRYLDTVAARQHMLNNGLKEYADHLEIVDREKNPIPYQQMPEFLKKYGYYVDIKIVENRVLQAVSKTALEALSCGLNVINYKCKIIGGFPEEHDAAKVAQLILNHYQQ